MKKPLAYSYVRMSRDLQLKGDSLRRQTEKSSKYAAENNLNLVEDSILHDIGVSAYKGANIKYGALGQFLEAVREGRVPAGSFLLVESLDRISRQEVKRSLPLFLDILESGIHVVTISDGHVFEAGKTDLSDLLLSLVTLSRAHEESRMKSERVGEAWDRKRRQAASKKMTRWCPQWLKLSTDRSKYEVIEERASVVRRIFNESVAGIGNYSITIRLNEDKVPTFSKSQGWYESYVAKILSNRAVIGEFQPHKREDGRSVPTGEAIQNYYPAIISVDLFNRAEAARHQRRIGGGRKGQAISNLFSKIAKCAYCNGRMHFEDKGQRPKGGQYLICDRARRGVGCEKARWRYDDFESSFLTFVQEIDLQTLLRTEQEAEERASIEEKLEAIKGALLKAERQRDITYNMLMEKETPYLHQRYRELETEIDTLTKQADRVKSELAQLRAEAIQLFESKAQIKALVADVQRSEGEETYKFRAQIASRLQSLIDVVAVAPVGGEILPKGTIERMEPKLPRFFTVHFKDGSRRTVYPSKESSVADRQIYVSEEESTLHEGEQKIDVTNLFQRMK
jgi:DNA invertase Pin-like site-specific DNA recombinase